VDRVSAFQVDLASAFHLDRASAFHMDRVSAFQVDHVSAFQVDRASAFQVDRASAFHMDRASSFQMDRVSAFQMDRVSAFHMDRVSGELRTTRQLDREHVSTEYSMSRAPAAVRSAGVDKPPLPLLLSPLRSRPLKYNLGVWWSAVSSPSKVWDGAPAETEFCAFSLKI